MILKQRKAGKVTHKMDRNQLKITRQLAEFDKYLGILRLHRSLIKSEIHHGCKRAGMQVR